MARVLVAVFVALLTGCAGSPPVFNSKPDLEGASRVDRLFVFANVKNKAFTDDVYAGFEPAMKRGLALCNVKSELLHFDAMDVDPKATLAGAIEKFQPDAVLIIRPAGGDVAIGQYGTTGDLIYDFIVSDVKAKKDTWRAKSSFRVLSRNMYADEQGYGRTFADGIVKQLRTDGVLQCPVAQPKATAQASAAP